MDCIDKKYVIFFGCSIVPLLGLHLPQGGLTTGGLQTNPEPVTWEKNKRFDDNALGRLHWSASLSDGAQDKDKERMATYKLFAELLDQYFLIYCYCYL